MQVINWKALYIQNCFWTIITSVQICKSALVISNKNTKLHITGFLTSSALLNTCIRHTHKYLPIAPPILTVTVSAPKTVRVSSILPLTQIPLTSTQTRNQRWTFQSNWTLVQSMQLRITLIHPRSMAFRIRVNVKTLTSRQIRLVGPCRFRWTTVYQRPRRR